MDVGDLATWVTGGLTAGALLLAAYQVREARRAQARVRQVDVDGVAVTWLSEGVPHAPDGEGNGTAVWVITVHNPGTLPIRDVEIALRFPVEFRRLRGYDHDAPSTELTDRSPAIEGGGSRVWRRALTVKFAERDRLREVRATVTFKDVSGIEHANEWGWGTQATATRTPG